MFPVPFSGKICPVSPVGKVRGIADKQSRQLLEYAKQAVEMAIEQGEGVALKWLKDKIPVEV